MENIRECHIKAGMTKDEVNAIIGEFVLLNDDIYTGKRYIHSWICLKCGKEFKKTWNAVKGGRENSRGYMCLECSKKITAENNKIKKQEREEENKNKIEYCSICGRGQKYGTLTKKMCYKHYEQYRKYGYCLDNNPRTVNDPNEIIKYEDYAEVILYDKFNNEKARAIIDLDDMDLISQYKWSLDNSGYARTRSPISISMHKLIMSASDDDIVDHKDHNRLNNKKENLRICTQSQNEMNKSIQSNNSSGFAGVYQTKGGLWATQIKINGETIPVATSSSFEKAVKIRKEAEEKYFGEHSLFNTCEDILNDLLKIKVGNIYRVILDYRLDFGIVTEIIDNNVCLMKPINFNHIVDEEIRVDISKLKNIEGIY